MRRPRVPDAEQRLFGAAPQSRDPQTQGGLCPRSGPRIARWERLLDKKAPAGPRDPGRPFTAVLIWRPAGKGPRAAQHPRNGPEFAALSRGVLFVLAVL